MIQITDHAIVRYLERVEGMDIESIRKKILPDDLVYMVKTVGSADYPVNEHRIRVRDSKIVTILTKNE